MRVACLIVVMVSGCVRAGFGTEAASDLEQRDGGSGDMASDGPPAEDGLGPLDQTTDSIDPQKTPPPVAGCLATCATGDCDGLPQYRDPEPNRCNELLFEETFGGPQKNWTTTGGSWSWQQGWFKQSAVDQSAWIRANASALKSADYLVEARFRLDATSSLQSWLVAVVGRFVHKDRYLYGGITLEPTFNPAIPAPDLLIRARRDARPAIYKDPANSGYSDGYPSAVLTNYTPPTFDTAPGREYYLQPYYTQNPKEMVICRLFDETSIQRTAIYGLYAYPTYKPHLPTEPGSVGFHTRNRGAAVDFIRVFLLHDTSGTDLLTRCAASPLLPGPAPASPDPPPPCRCPAPLGMR